MNIEKLVARRNRAVGEAEQWRSLLEKAYDYAAPNKNSYKDTAGHGDHGTTKGQNLTAHIYDLTLPIGVRSFVNRLSSALVPQTDEWVKFVSGQEIPEKVQSEVTRKLQALTKYFYSHLNNSNFYVAVAEAFEDCAISTGVLQINEGDDAQPLVFSSVPSNSISFETGIDGSFKGYFRDFRGISIDDILQYWPDSTITSDMQTIDNTEMSKPSKKLHIVESTLYDYKTKLWNTVIFELNLKQVVYEMSEEEPAFVAFRWNRRPGETYGRGPALDAMPAAASINEAMRDELISAAFKATPAFVGFTDAAINWQTVDITPGVIIPVMPTMGGGLPIQPLPMAGDVNFGLLVVQDLRDQINKLLFTSPLGPINSPTQSATEVALRARDFSESSASSFPRVQREFTQPLMKRCIHLLKKRGDFPPVEVDGREVELKFETPLTQTKGQREVEKFLQYHQALVSIIGAEGAAAVADIKKVPFFLAQNYEADLSLISTPEEIESKQREMQQQLAQQQQQQQPQQQEQF